MIVRTIVLGIALVAMMGAAAQAEEDDFGRPGFYVGAGFALGFENFDSPDDIQYETALGVDGWVGYRIIPNLAVELELAYLTGFAPVESGTLDSGLDILTLTGNIKGYVLTGRVQPYVLGGIGMADVAVTEYTQSWDDHVQQFAGRLGLGVDFYVTEHFSVGARGTYVLATDGEYDRAGNLQTLQYMDLTIGGQFRF